MYIYLYEYGTGQFGDSTRDLEFVKIVTEKGETIEVTGRNIIECESFRGQFKGSWIECTINGNKEFTKTEFINLIKEFVEKHKAIIVLSSNCACPLPRGHYYIYCGNRAFIITKEPIKHLYVKVSGVLCRHCLDPGEYEEIIDISNELLRVKKIYLIQCTARSDYW